MKILRYQADGETAYGILEEDGSILRLIGSPFDKFEAGPRVAKLSDVRLLAPVEPQKVIGVGANYLSHIKEGGGDIPEFPMLFMKPSTAVLSPDAPIVIPRRGKQTEYKGNQNVEHEAELVAVMGKRARNVPESSALDYVLGYTCGNDVSEREMQAAEMNTGVMLIGKGFDTFAPLGPVIATGLDPTNLDIKARLNGESKQDANTSDLLFGVAKLVSFISEAMELLPGDVIMTGTAAGPATMVPGDVIEIEISGIGVLRNPVVAEQ